MIRNDAELTETMNRLRAEGARCADYRRQLQAARLPEEDCAHAMRPLEEYAAHLGTRIQEYEHAKQGNVPILSTLENLGRILVLLRIAAGITQRELASRLRVHESVVSRDERTAYDGVTIHRAAQVLAVLEVELNCSFRLRPEPSSLRSGTKHG